MVVPEAWGVVPLSVRPGRGRPPDEREAGPRAPRNHRHNAWWTTPCPWRAPYSSVGLFADELSRVVTCGWLVTPEVVLTAGHCVLPRRPQEAHSAFWFATLNENCEWGWVRVKAAATLAGFAERRDYRYDVAVCRLEHALDGGGLWPGYSAVAPARVQICGCPQWSAGSQAPPGGYRLWRSDSSEVRWSSQGGWAATNLAEGCSGGPWLAQVGDETVPCGLTSRGSAGFLLSPPFTRALLPLLAWAGASRPVDSRRG